MYGCQAFILSVRLTNILPPFCQVHDTLSRNRFVSQGIFYFPLENQRDVIDLLLWPDMASVTFEESDRCFESVRITSL